MVTHLPGAVLVALSDPLCWWCARRGSTIFIPGTHKNNAQRQAIVDGAKYNDGRRDEMLAKVKAKYSMLSAGCAPPRTRPGSRPQRSAQDQRPRSRSEGRAPEGQPPPE